MDVYPANTRWGRHAVVVRWQIDDFKAEAIIEVGGNCKGGSILENVISSVEDGDFEPVMEYPANQKHLKVDADGYLVEVMLFDKDDNETSFDADLFFDFLVGVEIVEFTPEARS